MDFVIKTGKGFFTGFDENKVTSVVDNQPYAQEAADVFDGTVVSRCEIDQPQKYYWRVKNEYLVAFSDYNGWLYLTYMKKIM